MKKHLLSVLMLAFATSIFAQSPFSAVVSLRLSSDLGFADENVTLVESATLYTSGQETGDSQKNLTITNPSQNVKMYALTGFSAYDYAGMLATNSLDGVELGFITNTAETSYTITFATATGTAYNLIDKYEGTATLITTASGYNSYSFTAPAGMQIDNRFEIRKIATVPGMDIAAYQDPDNTDDYYTTFYHSGRDFKLPANAEAYVAKLTSTSLSLTKVANPGQVIPAGVALILKASTNLISLTTTDETPVSITEENSLLGKDYATSDIPANCYVFSGHSTNNEIVGIGFYPYEGTQLKANKAYVIWNGSSQAPRHIPFVYTEEQSTTAIDHVAAEEINEKFYENGQLFIRRGDKIYNVQGQQVK